MALFSSLVLFYAGETGNCEDLSKRIYNYGRQRRVKVTVNAIDDFGSVSVTDDDLVLFICSTTGHGDVPLNMKQFWRLVMRKNVDTDLFGKLNCCVIGLGDSSYVKYNVVAKKLFKRLDQLGANLVSPLTLGDDQHDLGFDASIDPFLETLWSKLTHDGNELEESTLPEASFLVEYTMCGKSVQVEARPPFSASNPFNGKIISNERVTSSEHFQDVRLLRVKVSPDVVYDAGDVVMVMPENSKQEVDELLDLLNLDTKWHRPGSMLLISSREGNVTTRQFAHLPTRLSLRKLITKYLSIHSVPKRSFFELLWKFSPDEIEREKLREFASTLGQEELYAYCLRPKRTALEVLADFPHTAACVTLEHLFDLFGAIKPRSFSIASSYSAHNDEVHILAALVEYRTTLKKPRVGLCSSFLATRREGDELDLWINKGTFVVPPPEVPIIMVGPGTGVAPFRSIIYERMAKRVTSPVRRQDVLFFGCRLRGADFYFEEEWSEMSHCLTTVVAFSRESADTKVYVQDKMWQEKDLVGNLILRGCVILVAGKSKQMPQDVRDTLARIVSSSQPGIDVDMFLNKLEQSKRLQYECWS